MLITSKFNNAENQWVFCVLDGHGVDGHKVSQYCRDNLCPYLLKQKHNINLMGKKIEASIKYAQEKKTVMEDDSLIYYSSVNEYTEANKSKDQELEYEKLNDEGTIFKQIQNYTKNVLVKKTFEGLNNTLKKQNFDYQYSGTTCNMIIISGKVLTCANVGDSRSIMGTFEGEDRINRNKGYSVESEETDHDNWK